VNDDTIVSMWQDGNVTEPQRVSEHQDAAPAPATTRAVDDVGTLRAMADPTRIAILAALMKMMKAKNGDLPVMSVKELAAELGEPQTKLYRHMRQLEAAGLVRVAATRTVSGIIEQRYQACQRDLTFGGGFLREHGDESEAITRALLDRFRDGFFAAFRDKRLAPDDLPAAESYRKPTMMLSEARVTPANAAELRGKLEQLMTWLHEAETDDPGGVPVNVLVGYYSPEDPDRAD
jgi:DNA-binding transcriptional ArsR family regulator